MFTYHYKLFDNTYIERHGLAPTEFTVGQHFVHRPGITMSQQENVNDALDSHNGAMLHFDEQYARNTAWQRPLMVSTLTVQRLLGMASKTFARQTRIVRMGSIAMTAPVFGGDTLYAETLVKNVHQPNPDGTMLLSLRTSGINQNGKIVAEIDYEISMLCGLAKSELGMPATDPRFASHLIREDGALVEQMGLFFEDLRAGETFIHSPRRTFMPEEAMLHAARALDVTPHYYDSALASSNGRQHLVIPQTWVLSVTAALSTRLLGRVTTNLGWVDVEYGAEVVAGDTLEVQTTVLALRDSSSRPNEGIATVATLAKNQRQETCLSYQRTLFVYRRGDGSPYAKSGY